MEHTVIRAVSGDHVTGWTVTFQCRVCDWSSTATAPTVAEAQRVQLAAKDLHIESGGQAGTWSPYTGAGPVGTDPLYQNGDAAPSQAGGCGGCLVLIVVVLLLYGLISSCSGSDDDPASPRYSDEECVALQLSAISGDDDSAAKYATYCD